MPAKRKFDHDDARRRYAAGEGPTALAREYGVSVNAVRYVVNDNDAANSRKQSAHYYARHTVPCEVCSTPTLDLGITSKRIHNRDGRILCARCRADAKRERLLFDDNGRLVAVRCTSADCANGERWQSPDNFTRGQRHREVRDGGIHGLCRACQTRARRDHRRRNREASLAYDREYRRRKRVAA